MSLLLPNQQCQGSWLQPMVWPITKCRSTFHQLSNQKIHIRNPLTWIWNYLWPILARKQSNFLWLYTLLLLMVKLAGLQYKSCWKLEPAIAWHYFVLQILLNSLRSCVQLVAEAAVMLQVTFKKNYTNWLSDFVFLPCSTMLAGYMIWSCVCHRPHCTVNMAIISHKKYDTIAQSQRFSAFSI